MELIDCGSTEELGAFLSIVLCDVNESCDAVWCGGTEVMYEDGGFGMSCDVEMDGWMDGCTKSLE